MVPTDINTAARDLYNATGDTYFTDLQIYNWIWQGENELAKKAWIIERLYSTTTTLSVQSYTYPSTTIAIKRITANGKKLKRVTYRDDDALTLSNQNATTMGWPIYYTDFNYTVNLRPIPDMGYTLNIYSYNSPMTVTATSTLEVPQLFHFDLVDYVLMRMFMKDKNVDMVTMLETLWKDHIKEAIAYKNKLKRSDGFATVQSEENLPVTIMGEA